MLLVTFGETKVTSAAGEQIKNTVKSKTKKQRSFKLLCIIVTCVTLFSYNPNVPCCAVNFYLPKQVGILSFALQVPWPQYEGGICAANEVRFP